MGYGLRTQNLLILSQSPDMEFVQNFTPPDFQAKIFTPPISPDFNSFSKKKTQKMSKNGKSYTTGKNFILPQAVTAGTAVTNLTFENMCAFCLSAIVFCIESLYQTAKRTVERFACVFLVLCTK